MQEDNTNPFQVNQGQAASAPPDNNYVAPIAPMPAEPVQNQTNKKPAVALDGVSPNYSDIDDQQNPQPAETITSAIPTAEPVPTDGSVTPNYNQYSAANPNTYQPVNEPNGLDNYVNPLIDNQPAPMQNPTNDIPELNDPNATAIEINPKAGGLQFKAWQFFLAIGVAVIGIAGTVFFLIEYNQTNASFQNSLIQLEEYRGQAETASKATQQLEELQETVREQADKITTLKEENDSLKKVEDELKSLREENDKLRAEKEKLVNDYAKLVSP